MRNYSPFLKEEVNVLGCLCTAVALLNVALLVAVSMTIGKIYGQLIERGQEVIDAFLEVALSCQEGAKSILVLLGASKLPSGGLRRTWAPSGPWPGLRFSKSALEVSCQRWNQSTTTTTTTTATTTNTDEQQ